MSSLFGILVSGLSFALLTIIILMPFFLFSLGKAGAVPQWLAYASVDYIGDLSPIFGDGGRGSCQLGID